MNPFKRDDVVEVVDTNKYREVHVGAIGTVRGTYETRVTVVFDDIHNPRSSYDCFYFNAKQLKIYKGATIMEGNYTIANVKFIEGSNADKIYKYALYDHTINIGDICVVKSAHHGFGLARIVDIIPKSSEEITREIVCKADFSDYEAREAGRKRRAELMKLMHERAAKLQETALFAMLAKEDTEMQQLLGEFNGIEVS